MINKYPLITVKCLSKKFCKNLKSSLMYGIQDSLSEVLYGQTTTNLRKNEFWALKDVSFELHRGECLGLIGRNGAGKTTLLKILSGLIKPDKGSVTLKGKVGGLIALGAGFNGILSGRENIKINGAILGYPPKTVDDKIDEIIDFAEIPEFIDSPVNTYSSGMSVRLGFAIAAILTKPDILLLDEVLAVGDIEFTIKCLNAVRKLVKNSAVVFVSHNMHLVSKFCTKTIVFEKGESIGVFNTSNGINKYLDSLNFQNNRIDRNDHSFKDFILRNRNFESYDEVNGKFQIDHGKKTILTFTLNSNINLKQKIVLEIHNKENIPILKYICNVLDIRKGINDIEVDLKELNLNSGSYSITIGLIDYFSNEITYRLEQQSPFFIKSDSYYNSDIIIQTYSKINN